MIAARDHQRGVPRSLGLPVRLAQAEGVRFGSGPCGAGLGGGSGRGNADELQPELQPPVGRPCIGMLVRLFCGDWADVSQDFIRMHHCWSAAGR